MMVVLSVGDSTVTSGHICRTQTHDPFPQNPHPFVQVRVLMGMGAGCFGKPQGFLCHSLVGGRAIVGFGSRHVDDEGKF